MGPSLGIKECWSSGLYLLNQHHSTFFNAIEYADKVAKRIPQLHKILNGLGWSMTFCALSEDFAFC